MKNLDDYRKIVGNQAIDEIIREAEPLRGKYISHVNATYYGGGVAEILENLVFLMNEIGINAGWRLLKGSDDFFRITKLFHNACQGGEIDLTRKVKKIYEETNQKNSVFMHLEKSDAIIAHDPQVLPLIRHYKDKLCVWRCHIDLTEPDKSLWKYLRKFINNFDAVIYSDKKYEKQDIKIPQYVIMPSIDPLSEKNKKISRSKAKKLLENIGISLNQPIISQISRYDYWKDPIGVIDVFEVARKKTACQLIMLGNYATDDPEGVAMYNKVRDRARGNKDIKVLVNVDNNDLVVNALQTISDIVLQKSLREGFALTVSEALWKGTPVIAGRVGGIPNQIIDGENGYLVDSKEECADRIIKLLKDKRLRKQMGQFGHEYVKQNFLITRHLLDYIILLKREMAKYEKKCA